MDTPAATEVLRQALALGADRAVLLSDRRLGGADSLATARTLAAAIRRLGPVDLVLCGAWSYHGNTGQVGPQLAELLGIAHVSFATRARVPQPTTGCGSAASWDQRYAVVEGDLPLLVTTTAAAQHAAPRVAHGHRAGPDKTVEQWGLDELGLRRRGGGAGRLTVAGRRGGRAAVHAAG